MARSLEGLGERGRGGGDETRGGPEGKKKKKTACGICVPEVATDRHRLAVQRRRLVLNRRRLAVDQRRLAGHRRRLVDRKEQAGVGALREKENPPRGPPWGETSA